MMKNLIAILMLLPMFSLAQTFNEKQCAAIVDEGLLLYKFETANTYTAELMAEHFPNAVFTGMLSYSGKKEITSIAWVEVGSKIIVSYTWHFPDPLLKENAKVENIERNATALELQLIKAYDVTHALLLNDPMFTAYNNINFSVDLIAGEKQTTAFVLSGTSIEGKIPLGNDYQISIGLNGEILYKFKLHSLQVMSNSDGVSDLGKTTATFKANDDESLEITSSMIATLLLYQKQINWNEFDYISKKNLSVFNLNTQQLTITDF